MRIRISQPGIYGGDGKEIAVGTEVDVKTAPTGWNGRYEVISGKMPAEKGVVAVTNPAPQADEAPVGPFTTEDGGKGWWSILDANGKKVGKGLREDDAKAFDTLSDDDKAAFATEHAKA